MEKNKIKADMMNKNHDALIISIDSIHAERIYSGDKKYELRKIAPKVSPTIVFMYETEKKAITGAFYVRRILTLPLGQLWNIVGTFATTEQRFYNYYSGYAKGVAYEIADVCIFDQPLYLTGILGLQSNFKAPQSFTYANNYPVLSDELYDRIENLFSTQELRLAYPSNDEVKIFKEVALRELSKNYDEVDDSFIDSIIRTSELGYDPYGYFTSNKDLFAVKFGDQIIGFIVLTYKRANTIKTGPTFLLEQYRYRGYGGEIRKCVEQYAIDRGCRKLYCSCSAKEQSVIKYLLKAGMRIEAHLFDQFRHNSSEMIFGKLLVKSKKAYPIFVRPNIEQDHFTIYQDSDFDGLSSFMLSDFSKSYIEIDLDFITKLILSTVEFHTNTYSSKRKIIYTGKDASGEIVNVAICSPKRGGAVKLTYLSRTSNYDAFAQLLSHIISYFRNSNKSKIYVTIPYSDYQTIAYFENMSFVKEGVLSEPYRAGIDMVQLGYLY